MKVIRNLLFIIFPIAVQGQPELFGKLEEEKNDSLKCEMILEALEYYKYQNVDTLMILADILLNYADKLGSVRFKESGYLSRSLGLKFKGDFNPAIEAAQQAMDLNKISGNKVSRAKILLNFADLQNALAYLIIKDSLQTAFYDITLTDIISKHELKESENILSQQQMTIQKQANRQRLILWISSILIISVILIFFYLKSRQELKRKSAEMEIEKAKVSATLDQEKAARLQQIYEMRSNFFANISHEFRTPLTLILSPAEQLLKENIKPEHNKFLSTIHQNASRLLGLVNQLLDLSKLESGKTKLKIEYHDLTLFCKSIGGLFESLAKQKNMDYCLNIPNEQIHGYFDKEVLEKILVNLLSNAFKFTSAGGVVKLNLANLPQDVINISVEDSGIGIPVENQNRLFERFMSFSDSELQNNTGIGLSIVHDLIELHKGSIRVKSEVGSGSVFTISINIAKNKYNENELISSKQNGLFSNAHLINSVHSDETFVDMHKKIPNFNVDKKPLLLIAEDNKDVSWLITDICKSNYEMITADNGKQALQYALEKIPDLIITDIMMPEMDGMQLCAAIRKHDITSHIPIVMLTARSDQADKLFGLKAGADDYLTKPFDADELRIRLNNLLVQRKKLQEHYKKVLHAFTPLVEKVSGMDSVFLQNLKAAIEKNLARESYGVSELAADLAMSRSQLHRKVSCLLGHAPNEIIRNMRLEKARMLIRQKHGTIAEIAFECGFSSAAYFSKCYKAYFGHTAVEEGNSIL